MISYGDVKAAADRIAGAVRPVTVVPLDPGLVDGPGVHAALEFMQHSGSFKARGAANFVAALLEAGRLPATGLVVSTGRNADLGFAWAAARHGVPVTAFLAENAPAAKAERLRMFGAHVRLEGADQAEAAEEARRFAVRTEAIDASTFDNVLTAAGAGTLLPEIIAAVPGLDTVVVAVGAGGLFSGVTAAADHHGVRVVGVEPTGCQALHAALAAGEVVDVPVDSVAADSLGALRVSHDALAWARTADVRSVLVDDDAIVDARQQLWDRHRLAVEHGSAATLAALISGAYVPGHGERVAVVLCGANTDPADLNDHIASSSARRARRSSASGRSSSV
ncbi:pyridoxal-phosphate dependent enzyme [Actinomadura barringtoniae]|uniref:pyridoxal-phosphate dependent enzyme n=1 Tax=Actinomadura barringtoniae TaxID=1427535 RepID=UPI001FB85D35|nr:pyridoxal-phosphate dependent enzyme [Actinomadura barringtoniae]